MRLRLKPHPQLKLHRLAAANDRLRVAEWRARAPRGPKPPKKVLALLVLLILAIAASIVLYLLVR